MNVIFNYSQERLMKVLLSPIISEKSTFVTEKNKQVIFLVKKDATKYEIKAAVEYIFKVQVKSIQVINRRGKQKRFNRLIGYRKHTRRAFISLQAGQEINLIQESK